MAVRLVASSKTQRLKKKRRSRRSEINAIIFSKIKQLALDEFLGLLDELRMLVWVISYLNQAKVYTEEYLSSDSQYDIYYTSMDLVFPRLDKSRCFYQSYLMNRI